MDRLLNQLRAWQKGGPFRNAWVDLRPEYVRIQLRDIIGGKLFTIEEAATWHDVESSNFDVLAYRLNRMEYSMEKQRTGG